MNEQPLISIITVVYNGEKHLEGVIQSVLNQTYKKLEYVIIDGASTDNTIGTIKKYETQLCYWNSEPDNGIYDAMNKAIEHTQGDFIGIINSDDYYEPKALEIIAREINNSPEVEIFFGDLYILNENIEQKQLQTYKKGNKLYKDFSIWHPTVFVKKTCYQKWGVFDLNFKIAADYELLLRFKNKGAQFKYINKPIANFREGGISYYNKQLKNERYRLQKMHTSCFNAYRNWVFSAITEILQKVFMKILGPKQYHRLRYKYLYH